MHVQEKLQAEAKVREKELRARFPGDQCIVCGTKDQKNLRLVQFVWRKNESTGGEGGIIFSAEHRNIHSLCVDCLATLSRRRRWFWPMRLLGQILMAAAICGEIASVVLLPLVWHSSLKNELIGRLLVPSVIVMLAALFTLAKSRQFSVPGPLLDMTRGGWLCREFNELPDNYRGG